jgi:hypothetical protein
VVMWVVIDWFLLYDGRWSTTTKMCGGNSAWLKDGWVNKQQDLRLADTVHLWYVGALLSAFHLTAFFLNSFTPSVQTNSRLLQPLQAQERGLSHGSPFWVHDGMLHRPIHVIGVSGWFQNPWWPCRLGVGKDNILLSFNSSRWNLSAMAVSTTTTTTQIVATTMRKTKQKNATCAWLVMRRMKMNWRLVTYKGN